MINYDGIIDSLNDKINYRVNINISSHRLTKSNWIVVGTRTITVRKSSCHEDKQEGKQRNFLLL